MRQSLGTTLNTLLKPDIFEPASDPFAPGIGKDDQVPAVWMLPREYHEQANEKQRKSIEMQVAVKAYTEFCSTDYATDEDRTILRNILEKMIGSELWIIPTTETSDETKNETK